MMQQSLRGPFAAAESASPSLPDTSSPSSSSSFSPSPTHPSTATLLSSTSHLPTGQAPSSPSLFSSPEARASHIHYIQPPHPSPSGLSPTRPTPSSSSSSSSHPVARRRISLRQPFLPNSPLSNNQVIHSLPASSTPASSHSPTDQPPLPSAQGSSKRKYIGWPFGQQLSGISSPKAQDSLARRRLSRSVVVARDPSPEPRASTASTAAPSIALSTIVTIREPYHDRKPFARKSAHPSGSTTPVARSTEDLTAFESRLNRTLSSELAQISLRHSSTITEDTKDTKDMGLARSFTKRLGRPVSFDGSQAKTSKPHPQISPPMGLISTTNQWVHNVPNIADLHVKEVQQRQISSSSSAHGSDSETSPTSEPPSMTDTSSVESFSPIEPNHLTPYFTPSSEPPKSTAPVAAPSKPAPSPSVAPTAEPEKPLIVAPALPRRSASHSKHEHERLARVRSFRSSAGSSELISHSQHNSLTSFTDELSSNDVLLPLRSPSRPTSTVVEEPAQFSPFSNELKQLDEVAEDFKPGAHLEYMAEDVEDRRVMQELGLKPYRVSEYLREIAAFREGLWALIEEEEEEEEEDGRAAWI